MAMMNRVLGVVLVSAYGGVSGEPGARGAITQSLLDYGRDVGLPVAIQYLQNAPFPDPLWQGSEMDYTITVSYTHLTLPTKA